MERVKHTFEPVYDDKSKILILGTFPSVKSREGNFYYHHPRNRFWQVIAGELNVPVPQTVDQKKEMLLCHGIAIWDVIKSCDIEGSSDSSICNVIPSDIGYLLRKAPISKIFANGGKAAALYDKYIREKTGVEIIKLPSTSPANAVFSLERLLQEWKIIVSYLEMEV